MIIHPSLAWCQLKLPINYHTSVLIIYSPDIPKSAASDSLEVAVLTRRKVQSHRVREFLPRFSPRLQYLEQLCVNRNKTLSPQSNTPAGRGQKYPAPNNGSKTDRLSDSVFKCRCSYWSQLGIWLFLFNWFTSFNLQCVIYTLLTRSKWFDCVWSFSSKHTTDHLL